MIEINSNINIVISARLAQIESLRTNPDPILRTVALAVLPELKHRVHIEGKDSSGGKIGTYSPGYMTVRTGSFKNAGRVSKGANKGKLKDAGLFVKKPDFENVPRPKYNRTTDTTVVLSLTRQMENDLSVKETATGYGIGYLNPENYKKAVWCEATYQKKILTKLTKGETELATNTAIDFLPEYLKTL